MGWDLRTQSRRIAATENGGAGCPPCGHAALSWKFSRGGGWRTMAG